MNGIGWEEDDKVGFIVGVGEGVRWAFIGGVKLDGIGFDKVGFNGVGRERLILVDWVEFIEDDKIGILAGILVGILVGILAGILEYRGRKENCWGPGLGARAGIATDGKGVVRGFDVGGGVVEVLVGVGRTDSGDGLVDGDGRDAIALACWYKPDFLIPFFVVKHFL